MFAEFFKELDMVHICPAIATLQQREEWNHHPRGSVVTDTDYRNSDNRYSVMHMLI